MTENLRYLPSVVWPWTGSETTPYYYVYGYDWTVVATAKATDNYSDYWVLYNRSAAIISAPDGWHLPTDTELYTLENYLSTWTCSSTRTTWECDPAGTALKEWGSSWFEALLSGLRNSNGSFYYLGALEYFWSSTESDTNARRRYLNSSNTTVSRNTNNKELGFGARCIKD